MRKRRFRYLYGTLPAILLAAALSGCGSAGNKSMNSYYESAADTAPAESGGGFYAEGEAAEAAAEDYDGGFYADDAAAEESVSQEGMEVTGQAVSERKLIKKVSLDVETEQFDTLLPSIEKRVTALGGYIEEMSSFSRNDQYSKD